MKHRNLFHYDGMTDLAALRNAASEAAARGETVLLHRHGYVEPEDGCHLTPEDVRRESSVGDGYGHELFEPGEAA